MNIAINLACKVPALKAPFPYFGGKSRVGPLVWSRFGDTRNYVEPFAGSLAMLLARPTPFVGVETVNDMDGLVANFWRAVKADAEAVAMHADWPVNENDMHARHAWLVGRRDDMTRRLEGDPEWYDAKVAGWWVWGMSAWIGNGWCSGKGPWRVVEDGGVRELLRAGSGGGTKRRIPHIYRGGRGVHRQTQADSLSTWFADLQSRLRRVRVCSGDWKRVTTATPTTRHGLTGVFLDPPYSASSGRDPRLYAVDSLTVAHEVRDWAVAHGDDKRLRIALCGYEGEHAMPASWECVPWKAIGGYGAQSKKHDNPNARRERIWFSPHCLRAVEPPGSEKSSAPKRK